VGGQDLALAAQACPHLRGDRAALEAAEGDLERLAASVARPGHRAQELPGREQVLLADVGEHEKQDGTDGLVALHGRAPRGGAATSVTGWIATMRTVPASRAAAPPAGQRAPSTSMAPSTGMR